MMKQKEERLINRLKLAQAIKKVRKEIFKLSRKEMACKLGLEYANYTRLETGEYMLYTSTLFRMEKLLGEGYIYKVYNYYELAENDVKWLVHEYKQKRIKRIRKRNKTKIKKKMVKLYEKNKT